MYISQKLIPKELRMKSVCILEKIIKKWIILFICVFVYTNWYNVEHIYRKKCIRTHLGFFSCSTLLFYYSHIMRTKKCLLFRKCEMVFHCFFALFFFHSFDMSHNENFKYTILNFSIYLHMYYCMFVGIEYFRIQRNGFCIHNFSMYKKNNKMNLNRRTDFSVNNRSTYMDKQKKHIKKWKKGDILFWISQYCRMWHFNELKWIFIGIINTKLMEDI